MKNKLLSLFFCAIICSSCSSNATDSYDKELSIVIDQTDSLSTKPDESHICASLGLNKDIYQGIRITLTSISEKDLNATEVVSLPAENSWLSNKTIREAKVAKFKNELHQKLDSFINGSYGSQQHSIIYRTCTRQLALLASRPAKYKALIVYSDLMENDEVSFYDPTTFNAVKYKPLAVQKRLEQAMLLNDLTTINIFLVYAPASYQDNNRYMTCSEFFAKVFKIKHAWIHIEPSF